MKNQNIISKDNKNPVSYLTYTLVSSGNQSFSYIVFNNDSKNYKNEVGMAVGEDGKTQERSADEILNNFETNGEKVVNHTVIFEKALNDKLNPSDATSNIDKFIDFFKQNTAALRGKYGYSNDTVSLQMGILFPA